MADHSRVWTHIDFNLDGKQAGNLHVPHSVDLSAYAMIQIPIVCIRNGEGPTALLTAGNHGDDYEGQIALRRMAQALRPGDVRAPTILVPPLHYQAVEPRRRAPPGERGKPQP